MNYPQIRQIRDNLTIGSNNQLCLICMCVSLSSKPTWTLKLNRTHYLLVAMSICALESLEPSKLLFSWHFVTSSGNAAVLRSASAERTGSSSSVGLVPKMALKNGIKMGTASGQDRRCRMEIREFDLTGESEKSFRSFLRTSNPKKESKSIKVIQKRVL